MVLNSIPEQTPLMLAHDLEPEVYTLEQLQETIHYCDRARTKLSIHLKLETGMHRLGFDEAQLSALISVLSATGRLEVVSVFSHLAASEAHSEDQFTQAQIRQFVRMADRITTELHITPLRHILNSNGVVRHPEAQFDMVRLGIGMYGIGMPAEVPLEVVHELRSYISQIKHVPAGSTIGYGRMERIDTDKDIATVAIGYADGLIRKAGNRRYALVVNGRPAPIVGNVCMDMTMIDVTGREDVMVGTPVTIFGTFPSISRLAEAGETIPYEVFTNLSERIKRVYIYE
jgi:alanine racemase